MNKLSKVGVKIESARKHAEWYRATYYTQEKFAAELNMSRSTYLRRVEKGGFTDDEILRVCTLLPFLSIEDFEERPDYRAHSWERTYLPEYHELKYLCFAINYIDEEIVSHMRYHSKLWLLDYVSDKIYPMENISFSAYSDDDHKKYINAIVPDDGNPICLYNDDKSLNSVFFQMLFSFKIFDKWGDLPKGTVMEIMKFTKNRRLISSELLLKLLADKTISAAEKKRIIDQSIEDYNGYYY